MSEPTYRIDVEHRPQDAPTFGPWYASVVRISDAETMTTASATTEQGAVDEAYRRLAEMSVQREPYSLFADEYGKPYTASVRA